MASELPPVSPIDHTAWTLRVVAERLEKIEEEQQLCGTVQRLRSSVDELEQECARTTELAEALARNALIVRDLTHRVEALERRMGELKKGRGWPARIGWRW